MPPLYFKLYTANFMDHKPDFMCGLLMVLILGGQLWLMQSQRKRGARWFVPISWRRDPNQYVYKRAVPKETLQAARQQMQQGGSVEGIPGEEICVICM